LVSSVVSNPIRAGALMNSFDAGGFEAKRIAAYFSHLVADMGAVPSVQVVCVAHLVSNTAHFLPALDSLAPISLLLPKPKTTDSNEAGVIRQLGFSEAPLSRDWSKDPSRVVATLRESVQPGIPIVLVDIGGYFAESIDMIGKLMDGQIAGVVEGTENGAQKYERAGISGRVPIVTVARSPLKLPEDFLVGSSIVFSIEAVLREQAQILQTRTACVIGYGRVGSGVAEVLRGRGIPTVVHDKSSIAMAEAAARGFQVFRRLEDALALSSLVISATGGGALDKTALAALRPGAVVATVTSADDEFRDQDWATRYRQSRVSDHIMRYQSDDRRYFWLLHEGNPVNFVHGAVIGPAIQLIEGEKLFAVHRIACGQVPRLRGRLSELASDARSKVADVWNDHFLDD
jgi:adenosylhomocysteinase